MSKDQVVVSNSTNHTYLHSLYCQAECKSILRLGTFQHQSVVVGMMKFCPFCGGKAYDKRDLDRDYWEILADSFSVDPGLLKEAYDMWDRNEYQRFRDFVEELKKEAGIT